jgi:HPt (histidine-containing phosphotransfer) domain-containing protein
MSIATMNTFDEAHALRYLDNDNQFLVQVVRAMQDVLTEQKTVMQQSLASDNFVRMRQCTHSHLPTLKIFGLSAAANVFEMFESAVSRQDMKAISQLKDAVMAHWHDVQRVLSEWLSSQASKALMIPTLQHNTPSYASTSSRFFPVDGP